MRRRNTSSSRPDPEVDMGKFFTSTCWYFVVYAATEDQLREALGDMNEKWPAMVEYIETTWLVHGEKFLRLHTNTSTHYGNTSTSRVEVAHFVLKEWLHSAHISVDTVWARYHALMASQHVEIKKALEDSRSKGKKDKYGRLFSLLKGKVSMYALGLMYAEFDRGTEVGERLEERCGHVLRTTHGLPCACDMHRRSTAGRRVHLDSIDVFWRTLVYDDIMALPSGDDGTLEELFTFIRNTNSPTRRRCTEAIYTELHPEDDYVEEPVVNENPRGRPRRSNARNLSGFEHSQRRSRNSSSTQGRSTTTDTYGSYAEGDGAPSEQNWTIGGRLDFPYRRYLPSILDTYVLGWFNPIGDGHCGFRCLSHATRGGNQSHYLQTRVQLGSELNDPRFMLSYGNDYAGAANRINFQGAGACTAAYWIHLRNYVIVIIHYNNIT
ncbi:hypothetical protein RND81_09G134300 [Saponaria officinalis]|uniref:Uncharacterized protein n=1 Tax=Saponaria officinalis TaxID=3572 RepID=A0AAW1IMA6_SAPOF